MSSRKRRERRQDAVRRSLHDAVKSYVKFHYPELPDDEISTLGYVVSAQLNGTIRSEQRYGRMTRTRTGHWPDSGEDASSGEVG